MSEMQRTQFRSYEKKLIKILTAMYFNNSHINRNDIHSKQRKNHIFFRNYLAQNVIKTNDFFYTHQIWILKRGKFPYAKINFCFHCFGMDFFPINIYLVYREVSFSH